ncbi:amidohydrolase family protein [soil metagenome]
MSDDRWIIRDATVIDGTGGEARPNQSIIVSGATIDWIGPTASEPDAAELRVVEATGLTVVPGLINSHVHLANDGAADLAAQIRDDSVPIASMRAARNARFTLESGITTVRDCGAANGVIVELAKAIETGLVVGPRVRAAGRVITMTGGHGHFMGSEADGVDGVRKAVRQELKDGAHFIKAMATGGVLTPGVSPTQTALLAEELNAIVQEAHNAGKRVSTHAIGRQGIENALRAGVDSIEHGFYLDDDLFEIALAQGTFLVPTLLAVDGIVTEGPGGGSPEWMIDKAMLEAARSQTMFKAAVDAGMKIAAGTDAGTPFNRHDDLVRELALMMKIGISPMQALVSATRNGAENAAILDRTGTLEVGKFADLLIVGGDPLADISTLTNIALVAKEGIVYRDDLARFTSGAELAEATR